MIDSLAGIPFTIDASVPENEVWLIVQGKKRSFRIHEGPHAGESTETWLQRPQRVRVVNLGEDKRYPKIMEFPLL